MKALFKKIIIAEALMFLLVIKSYGQIDMGVKGGINVSSQLESGVSVSSDDLIVGLNVGGIFRYHLKEWLALRSDISYVQKGRRYLNPLDNSKNLIQDRFHYLIIPLKAEISTGERLGLKNGAKLLLAAGPYYGFLLDAERKDNGSNTSLNETTENYDYGMSLDLGFELPVKDHSVTFGANYEIGLSKFAEYDNELRNTTISFSVGYIF